MTLVPRFVRLKASKYAFLFDHRMPSPKFTSSMPKNIWLYWGTGFDTAPDIIKYCAESWRVTNPGWTIHLLDDRNIAEFVDVSDIDAADVPIQKKSNVLRLRLCHRYGGVWTDATVLCAAPLDHWLYAAMQTDAFFFSYPRHDRIVSSWFVASFPDSWLLREIDRVYTRYLTDPPIYKDSAHGKPPYHNFHFTIEFLARFSRRFRKEFNHMPKIAALPLHLLQRWLKIEDKAAREVLPDLRGLPVHKLTWKSPIDLDELSEMARGLNPALCTVESEVWRKAG